MVKMQPETKKRLAVVWKATRTVFVWGYVPFILYLGFKKGADPGMPEPTLLSLLWA
ncbi:mitochondrial import receptor subunit TOM7 homolog [Saccoglossus kowalevskii]